MVGVDQGVVTTPSDKSRNWSAQTQNWSGVKGKSTLTWMRIIAEPEILNSPVTTPGNPDQLMILLGQSRPRVSEPVMGSRRSGFPTDSEESVPPTFLRASPANRRSVASDIMTFCPAGPEAGHYSGKILVASSTGRRIRPPTNYRPAPTNFATYTPTRRPAARAPTITTPTR